MTSDILRRLAEPFDPSIVSFRVGPTTREKDKGMALAYIDARDVMNRLDAVMGPGRWQDNFPWSDGKRVVCSIGIKIEDEWIWKTDGAGDTDEEGEKGALSDAFKRAAVKFGIGRYLYDVEATWVKIDQRGKSYVIAPAELPRLRHNLPKPGVPTVKGEPVREAPPPGYGNRATPPNDATEHPKRSEAIAAYNRLKRALNAATLPKLVDEIVSINGADLNLIKEVHAPSYEDLMSLSSARKSELLAAA